MTGDIFTGRVESIASNGCGILSHEGRRVFADFTAPGDVVVVRAAQERKGFVQAEVLEIVEPSPERAEPICPLFGRCGGCSLQHLSYEAQVAEKTRILADAFTRIGGFDALPQVQVVRSEPFGYRNRVQFHSVAARPHYAKPHAQFQSGTQGTKQQGGASLAPGAVGFMARQSGEIIPALNCPIADEGINRALAENRIVPPVEKDRFSVYAYKDTFLSEGRKSRGTVSLLVSAVAFPLASPLERSLIMDAGVFFQSNARVLEALIKDIIAVAGQADAEKPAVDLFCGVGTFASFLNDIFQKIDMVEENKISLSIARDNIHGAGKEHFALSCDNWAKIAKTDKRVKIVKKASGSTDTSGNAPSRSAYGFAVIDPPRTGLSPGIRSWLCQSGPPILAYVSCDPATQARDGRELVNSGYALASLAFYDFYPQTAHIESLAVFCRE